MQQLKLRRDVKIHTPGEALAGDLVDPPAHKLVPTINESPEGLPHPDSIDMSKLTKPVLTSHGWLVPEILRPGGA